MSEKYSRKIHQVEGKKKKKKKKKKNTRKNK